MRARLTVEPDSLLRLSIDCCLSMDDCFEADLLPERSVRRLGGAVSVTSADEPPAVGESIESPAVAALLLRE